MVYAWKSGMAPRQIQIAQRYCGDILVRLGYETTEAMKIANSQPILPRAAVGRPGRRGAAAAAMPNKWSRGGGQRQQQIGGGVVRVGGQQAYY